MSKKKLKHHITNLNTQRFLLHHDKSIKFTNKSGTELLVTVFPTIVHNNESGSSLGKGKKSLLTQPNKSKDNK